MFYVITVIQSVLMGRHIDILLYWAPPLARYERIADTSRISRILTILFGHPPLYLEAAGSREKSFCTDCRHMTILSYWNGYSNFKNIDDLGHPPLEAAG